MLSRDEPELGLGSGPETFTRNSSRADCDLRLDGVVSGIKRVTGWVDKSFDPVFLVRFECEVPGIKRYSDNCNENKSY